MRKVSMPGQVEPAGDVPSLQQVLDEVGRKAQQRGLTQEILESLLKRP